MSKANEASTLDAIVMSLQPCPHCGARAVDAYKKLDIYGMSYFIVFEENDCMHCYGKTGVLQIPVLTKSELLIAKQFRLVT